MQGEKLGFSYTGHSGRRVPKFTNQFHCFTRQLDRVEQDLRGMSGYLPKWLIE